MAIVLNTFPTNAETALALVKAVSEDLRISLRAPQTAQTRALLLVSGGKSPLPFFSALSATELPWERIDVSLVDERCVPSGHPDANAGLVKRHLLQSRAAKARFLSLVPDGMAGQDDLDSAARFAEMANLNPDLVKPAAIVLGLGTDGHTASLFRDSPQWSAATTSDERYVALVPGQAPHARISLSLNALVAQGKCYVWSNGAEKLEVIKQARALAAATADALLDGSAMHSAGAFALLVAHPQLELQVFHSDE